MLPPLPLHLCLSTASGAAASARRPDTLLLDGGSAAALPMLGSLLVGRPLLPRWLLLAAASPSSFPFSFPSRAAADPPRRDEGQMGCRWCWAGSGREELTGDSPSTTESSQRPLWLSPLPPGSGGRSRLPADEPPCWDARSGKAAAHGQASFPRRRRLWSIRAGPTTRGMPRASQARQFYLARRRRCNMHLVFASFVGEGF
jgi:hypothetical protein